MNNIYYHNDNTLLQNTHVYILYNNTDNNNNINNNNVN